MKLALPSFLVWLLGFYNVFHCCLNIAGRADDDKEDSVDDNIVLVDHGVDHGAVAYHDVDADDAFMLL